LDRAQAAPNVVTVQAGNLRAPGGAQSPDTLADGSESSYGNHWRRSPVPGGFPSIDHIHTGSDRSIEAHNRTDSHPSNMIPPRIESQLSMMNSPSVQTSPNRFEISNRPELDIPHLTDLTASGEPLPRAAALFLTKASTAGSTTSKRSRYQMTKANKLTSLVNKLKA
jgi:hypothetical protein